MRCVRAGRHTFLPDDIECHISLSFGKFCSIASGLKVTSGQHPPVEHPEVVSTFAFRETGWSDDYPASKMSGAVTVGHDVWIGERVTLLDGVHIGHGAIVAACSVVTSDVPPYAVVAGNPAIIRKMRFPDDIVGRLLNAMWWNWSDDEIRASLPRLRSVYEFLGS